MATNVEIRTDGVYIDGEKATEEKATYYRRLTEETYDQYEHPEHYPKDHRGVVEIIGGIFRRQG